MLLLYLQLLSLGNIFDETWYRLPSTPTKLLSAYDTNGVPGSGGDGGDGGGSDDGGDMSGDICIGDNIMKIRIEDKRIVWEIE